MRFISSLFLLLALTVSADAAVYAKLIQRNMMQAEGTDAVFDIFYGIVDTTAQTSAMTSVWVYVPMSTPGTWEDSFKAAVVTHAATIGYTLTMDNLSWDVSSPADYQPAASAVAWTKDVTKTNIPTTYTNLYAGNAGEGQLINAYGKKQYRLVVSVNKVGTGTQDTAIVDVTNAANLVSVSDTGAAGEHTLDSGWIDLPAWLKNGEIIAKPSGRSSLATDDPIYHQVALYLR
jgi:hypothetical protein